MKIKVKEKLFLKTKNKKTYLNKKIYVVFKVNFCLFLKIL